MREIKNKIENAYNRALLLVKEKGNSLPENELFDVLLPFELNEKEIGEIFSRLTKVGVHVLDENEITVKEASNSSSLKLYLSQMGQYPLLTQEEIASFARKAKEIEPLKKALKEAKKSNNSDEEKKLSKSLDEAINAKNSIILSNLRLVVSIAKQYAANKTLPLIDLIQEGNIGLEKAALKFDPDKGYQFSTYAYWWIRQAMLEALNNNSRMIRIPAHTLDSYKKLQTAYDELANTLSRAPTIEELAKKTSFSEEQINNLLTLPLKTVSMDAPVGDDGDDFSSFIPDNNEEDVGREIEEEDDKEAVSRALTELTPREKEVIARYFGLNGKEAESLEEIGRSFGVSRERIRQIREKALLKMRKGMLK